ncbi:MAG: phage protease [Thermodesulfovibrionales bacterium]
MKAETVCLKAEIPEPPGEVQVLPYGRHETEKGAFVLDEEGLEAVLKDFNGRRNDMVVDYEHQTLSGAEAPAAGWIKGLVDKGRDGLWAVVEWTDRAKEYLRNREYRYLSPVFLKDKATGRVVRLLNAALTNQPAIDGMAPVVNKGNPSAACITEGGGEISAEGKEESMEKLLELLGLPRGAAAEEAARALSAMKEEAASLRALAGEVRGLLGLEQDAGAAEVTGTIEAMKQAGGLAAGLEREVSELRARLRGKEAEDLVSAAVEAGKVIPAQRGWALEYARRDPEGFAVFAAKAPVVVHTGEVASSVRGDRGQGGIEAVQALVNEALGISGDTFRKHMGNR